MPVIYLTEGLAKTLLRLAADDDPDSVTIPLATTQAADLPDADLPAEAPVFTHFYMPDAGGSVSAVFGVDLGTPVGQSEGLFVSHPVGELEVSLTDDLHEVVFVAVPPWEAGDLAAFDRRGDRQDLRVLDVEPPEETVLG